MTPTRTRKVRWSRRATLFLVCCFALVGSGCRSSAVPFAPLPLAGPHQTWSELDGIREGLRGARSQATIRVRDGGTWRSVRARMILDASGRLLVDFYTPFGTPAATLFVDGEAVTWIDHLQQSWWSQTGARSIPIIGSLPGGREAALLLFGLPPVTADPSRIESEAALGGPCGVWICRMTATGLQRADAVSGDVQVEIVYEPPVFPPERVTLRVSGPGAKKNEIRIEHIEILAGPVKLDRPAPPENYRRVKGE